MNNFNYKNLTPFKWFVLENFPYIEVDFDALTNWGLFCKLGEEINKVIDSQNIVGEQAENLTNAFNNLKNYVDNYFNNLDVQDEINNKLNEMVQSGELQNIIGEFLKLNSLLTFNNVEDLKNSENLIEGSFVQTLGYYSINDGGKSLYKVKNINNEIVIDNASIIPLKNNLIAELITNNANLISFGCHGDGLFDDTENFNKCLNYAKNHNILLTSPSNKTYLINETLNISNINIDLNNSIIKTNSNIPILSINTTIPHANYNNIVLDLNNISECGIKIIECRKSNFSNFIIKNISNIGVIYNKGYELNFNNFSMYGTSINSIGFDLKSGDSNFTDIFMQDVVTAFQTTNVLNKFTRVHAWIGTKEYYQYSKFFNIVGKAIISCTDCYCDTMRYFINIVTNGLEPIIQCTNLRVLYANWVYTDPTMESLILKGVTSSSDSGNINIINSFIQGINGYNIKISNITFMGQLVNNVYSYLREMDKINLGELILPDGVTADVNRINRNGNIIEIQAILHFNISNLSSRYVVMQLPNYVYKPKYNLISSCYLANSSSIGDKQSITPISLNVAGQNVENNNVSFYVPNTINGNCTVSINTTYVKNI